MSDNPVREAKRRLPLPALMERCGLGDHAKKSARCPFHDDGRPSFSVWQSDTGWRWKCLASCGSGDEITFLEMHEGLSNADAIRRFFEMSGVSGAQSEADPSPRRPRGASRPRPALPMMDAGTTDELRQLAALRKVSFHSLFVGRGEGVHLLRFATLKGHRAWIVTDAEGLNAQARRLDGGTWDHLGGAKAYTLPGCWASWPLGAKAGERYPKFVLIEGGPDMLAALHFIVGHRREAEVFPVAMLGAGQRIHADALPFFAGKRVRIFPHDDKPGREGSERWAAQLSAVGADVDCFAFAGLRKADGSPVNDLNDCTAIHPDDAGELEGLLP